MYGPPDPRSRPATSPPILLLVSGLTGVLGFLIGMFTGLGFGESNAAPSASPGAEATVRFQEPPTEQPATEQPVGETPSPQTSPGATASPEAPPGGMRLLVVGTDIQPGVYGTTGAAPGQPGCFWARLATTDPVAGGVIESGMPTGPATVTVQPTDKAFQTSGCAEWVRQ